MSRELDTISKVLMWTFISLIILAVPIGFFPVWWVLAFDIPGLFPNIIQLAIFLVGLILIIAIAVLIILVIRLFYFRWQEILRKNKESKEKLKKDLENSIKF